MAEIPRSAFTRSAKIAGVPVSHAGRRVAVASKRLIRSDHDADLANAQMRTAEQMFAVLGTLKGGAMKLGQALSVFEAALPEEFMAPYREQLTKLQDSAPPMSAAQVESQMVAGLGPKWRERFAEFNDQATAAASIGQVHRAIWHDGREVAVKIQYPGAADAIKSDLNQLSRFSRLFGLMAPGLDLKSLMNELKERVVEELDYLNESKIARRFAAAYEGHPDFLVPHVVAAGKNVMITEWVESRPLSQIIASGTQEERNHFGQLYLRFLLSGPSIAGWMHADPHPGNFRVMADGRLAILDFGAAAELPDGLPVAMGRLLSVAMAGDKIQVTEGLRSEGFIRDGVEVDPQSLVDYLAPFTAPAAVQIFHHSRDWLRSQFERTADPRNPDWALAFKINLPPSYLLIHRTWLGSIGVLCQLGAEFSVRDEFVRWIPEFTPPTLD